MYVFLAAAVTALAVENPVFARALGMQRESLMLRGPGAGIILGAALTWLSLTGSLLAAAVNFLLIEFGLTGWGMLRPLIYFVGVAGMYALTARVIVPRLGLHGARRKRILLAMPFAGFNTALFGAFYIAAAQGFSSWQTVGYALGSGVGYTAAIMAIYYARIRLAAGPAPRSFRGMPVLMVYMGLVSLALYGLIGMVLPT